MGSALSFFFLLLPWLSTLQPQRGEPIKPFFPSEEAENSRESASVPCEGPTMTSSSRRRRRRRRGGSEKKKMPTPQARGPRRDATLLHWP